MVSFKRQSCRPIETSQLICRANQMTGFYMIVILAFNKLKGGPQNSPISPYQASVSFQYYPPPETIRKPGVDLKLKKTICKTCMFGCILENRFRINIRLLILQHRVNVKLISRRK